MIPVNITFYGDVGFDRSYQHVIDFETEEQRDGYFNEKAVVLVTNCAYNKTNNVMRVELPLSECQQFTYCSFDIGEKTYYCWVDGCDLVNDLTTEISITIDPWQTFLFQFTIGESFITRQHYDRFTQTNDGYDITPIVNSEHPNTIYKTKTYKRILDTFSQEVMWLLLAYVSEPPNLNTGQRINMVIFPMPADPRYYNVNVVYTIGVLEEKYKGLRPANVIQGDYCYLLGVDPASVVGVYLTPTFPMEFNAGYNDLTDEFTINLIPVGTSLHEFAESPYDLYGFSVTDVHPIDRKLGKTFKYYPTTVTIPTDGSTPNIDCEPQVFKQPYFERCMVDEVGNIMGSFSDVVIPYGDGDWYLYTRTMLDPSSPYTMIGTKDPATTVRHAQATTGGSTEWTTYEFPSALAEGTTINVPMDGVAVPSDNWLTYAITQRETDREMVQSTVNQRGIQNAITSIVSTGGISGMVSAGTKGGFLGGAVTGALIGAVGSVANYVVDNHYSWEQQGIKERGIQNSTNNLLTPSTTIPQMFMGSNSYYYVERVADPEVRNRAWQNFHKYGYPFATTGTPNLKSRKYWNYVETTQCKINGALTNDIKNEIAEIFNNGVTIWHGDNIDDLTGIGDYTSYENIERSLI